MIPTKEEQNKIVDILSEVDKNIVVTEKIIFNARKMKVGLMQKLLLKGLPGKHSQFNETPLGEIPLGWSIKELQEISKIAGRVGWKGYTVKDLTSSGPLTLGANNINPQNKLVLSNVKHLSQEKYKESPEIMVSKNDILIVQRGSLGKIAIIDEEIGEATINPSMVLVKEINMNPDYLYLVLCSKHIQKEISLCQSQTGVPMISQKQIKSFKIPIPPKEEQDEIVNLIYSFDDKINIELSKKRNLDILKKGLMQKLLTGQMRVKVD